MTHPDMLAARRFRLSCAKSIAGRVASQDADFTAGLLDSARRAVMAGYPVAAVMVHAVERSCYSATVRDAATLAVAIVGTLAGSPAAFDKLTPQRKANVLRYAVAALATAGELDSPWGPQSPAVGPAVWAEVCAA